MLNAIQGGNFMLIAIQGRKFMLNATHVHELKHYAHCYTWCKALC